MLTTRFVNGAPNWLDISTPDIDGATAFYGGLFDWQFRSAGPDAGGYGFFQLSGRTAAGGMGSTGEMGPPSWTLYFRTPDAQSTAEAAEQAGGTVLFPPMDVMGEGHMAVLADPAGVPFGLWQPGRIKGIEVAGERGSLCWIELYTPDIARAAAFYHRTLGWETEGVPFPGGTYTCLSAEGRGAEDGFGGMIPSAEDPVTAGSPYWLPYFEVADPDTTVSRAQGLGGTLLMPATDVAGVGRIARLADPYGAQFAIIKSVQAGPQQG
ncbi:VOC family protein [Streptomyces nodosus]